MISFGMSTSFCGLGSTGAWITWPGCLDTEGSLARLVDARLAQLLGGCEGEAAGWGVGAAAVAAAATVLVCCAEDEDDAGAFAESVSSSRSDPPVVLMARLDARLMGGDVAALRIDTLQVAPEKRGKRNGKQNMRNCEDQGRHEKSKGRREEGLLHSLWTENSIVQRQPNPSHNGRNESD